MLLLESSLFGYQLLKNTRSYGLGLLKIQALPYQTLHTLNQHEVPSITHDVWFSIRTWKKKKFIRWHGVGQWTHPPPKRKRKYPRCARRLERYRHGAMMLVCGDIYAREVAVRTRSRSRHLIRRRRQECRGDASCVHQVAS